MVGRTDQLPVGRKKEQISYLCDGRENNSVTCGKEVRTDQLPVGGRQNRAVCCGMEGRTDHLPVGR